MLSVGAGGFVPALPSSVRSPCSRAKGKACSKVQIRKEEWIICSWTKSVHVRMVCAVCECTCSMCCVCVCSMSVLCVLHGVCLCAVCVSISMYTRVCAVCMWYCGCAMCIYISMCVVCVCVYICGGGPSNGRNSVFYMEGNGNLMFIYELWGWLLAPWF